ncbi:DMT family transporter [Marinomonas sp. 2405UD68-3]|uniref:DMT family transporter n=1 Tax=Marinomonas sp. 2405UD68-3 TaxID=3391835 RepID=UPI0039C92EC5
MKKKVSSKSIIFLYISTIVIWSTTWYPIKLSLDHVSAEISVVYRLAIASTILFAYICVKKLPLTYTLKQHLFIMVFGVLLYGVNLTLLYSGSYFLTSGVVAIVFSSIVIMNIINGRIFLSKTPTLRSIIGSTIGIAGLVYIFWSDLKDFNWGSDSLVGLGIIILATLSASLGNITSMRNQKDGIPITQANALAMAYGAVFLTIYCMFQGIPFAFEYSGTYIGSLIYLSVFGSVLAFGFYLKLLDEIGADKAAYANLLFPILAMIISFALGEQEINNNILIGIVIVISGNYLMNIKSKPKQTNAEVSQASSTAKM